MKLLLTIITLVLTTTHSQAAIILQSGESYSSDFTLLPTPNTFKPTDNYWDVGVDIVDSAAPPFTPGGNAGTLTLSLFENTNFTGLITSFSESTAFPSIDGVLFFGEDFGLFDFNGSLTLTYEGDGEATINSIFVGVFGGGSAADPSGVSSAVIIPVGMPIDPVDPIPPVSDVSAPTVFGMMLALSGIMFARKRVHRS